MNYIHEYLAARYSHSTTLGPSVYGYMGSLGDLLEPHKYHVIDYAQRGTQEYPSHDPFTLNNHLQDLHNQVTTHALRNYSIIGYSWGCQPHFTVRCANPA